MRGGIRRIFSGAALILALTGCGQTFDATRLGLPVTMASPAGTPTEGDKFILYSHSTYALWGVIQVSQPSLRKALAAQIGTGTGVADLKIQIYSGFTDVLITILSAGIIVPRTVRFEGVVTGAAPATPAAPGTK